MKPHAIHSHLECIANNLDWIKDASQKNALSADKCPSREQISQRCGRDTKIDDILCDCERACVGMRDAFNRRELSALVAASKARTVCLAKLTAALKAHGYGAQLQAA